MKRSVARVHTQARSAFLPIERHLAELGFVRHPWELLSLWLGRIEEADPADLDLNELSVIIERYSSLRYDPLRGTDQDLEDLVTTISAWLEKGSSHH